MSHPRIALLIETSGGYGRNFLAGVASYSRLNGPWSFYVIPKGHDQTLPDTKLWETTGIIARIESKEIAKQISAARLPTIGLDVAPELLHGLGRRMNFCEMHPDPKAIASLAAQHLMERGFTSFAYVGLQDYWFSREREKSFADVIARQHGRPCPVFHLRERNRTANYGLDLGRLEAWLKGLPKPVGLLACNDDCGREVLDAALIAGITVPDEMSLMGVDNDEVLCDLCFPPLSSIIPNAFQAGFEAATLLQRMIVGENLPAQTVMINPIGVATRQSTDVVAVNDKQVAAAVRFIRENACKRIAVEDVLKSVPMSRTLLERRFKKLLGHTPHDYILKVKIERLKHMLVNTDLSLALIAESTGFEHVEYLSVAFKRATGISPSAFRSKCKMLQGRRS